MKEYLQLIEEEIEGTQYPNRPSELYDPIHYILSLGGKRIRPIILMMAAEMFGADKASKKVIQLAKAIEIFHNFSLVHDDIMDEAPLRRGKQTVHEKWNRDIAILSGDVMLVQAYQAVLEAGAENVSDLLDQFNQSAIKVCEGQQFDMNYETEAKVSIADYIEMISLKTAELIGCSLKMGAMAAGASAKDAKELYDFGVKLGISFQIQDDLLDAFGESDKVGKQKGGDILANKKTYLLLSALELAKGDKQEVLQDAMNLEGANKVEQVLAIFEELGVKEITQKEMEDYYQQAMCHLESVDVADELKNPLRSVATMLLKRDH